MIRVLTVLSLLLALPAPAAAKPGPSEAAVAVIETLGLRVAATPAREAPTWAPPERVAILLPGSLAAGRDAILAEARRVAGDAEIVPFDGSPGSFRLLADADVVLGFCAPAILESAPRLRWLHSYSVGVERCTRYEQIDDYDFVLTNNQRLSGPDIAEHALALTLAVARNFDHYAAQQQEGRWDRAERRALNLDGRTMLVLGLGGIGTEIARRADALGMRVVATRNSSRSGPDFVDYVGLADEAAELAGSADVIVNALPLTDTTAGSIDAPFFNAAKDGAIYVSVGRGGTTDSDALLAALDSGKLRGAGLDVTDPEPLPVSHPLWDAPHVIITPHVAANTDDARRRTLTIALENLRRYALGEPLLSVVDFERGY